MRRIVWVLGVSLSIAAGHAQTCPAVNFQQPGSVTMTDDISAAGLVRQPDGAFSLNRYQQRTPFNPINSLPNYQTTFLNCSGVGARTFRNAPGWSLLTDQPGAASRTIVVADLLGNGNAAMVAFVPRGSIWGPSYDSVEVVVFNADGSHRTPTFYVAPQNTSGLLVADLNHDGKKDVVVVGAGPASSTSTVTNTIAVMLGNGDGTLQPPVLYSADVGALAAVALDFNGDTHLDLAVVNNTSHDLSVLMGRGDGTFSAPVNYPLPAGLMSIAVGDFNGDGKADLVVGASLNLSVLLGNGNGTFRAAVNLPQAFNINFMAPGDFNKDGKLDLALVANGAVVSILLGDGLGKFAGQFDYIGGYEPGSIFATDLDGDGNLDVVVGTGHPDVLLPNEYSNTVVAFFGRGDGTLTGPPAFKVGYNLKSMVLADFDGDGKPDLAAAASQLWLLMSRGGGSFKTPVPIALPTTFAQGVASAVVAGDFNGDGKQDLAVADSNGNGIFVLLGKGDGTFQVPVNYATNGNLSSIAIGDFNGDGKIDLAVCGTSYSPPSGSSAGIFLGNGNGAFQSFKPLSGFGTAPQWLVVGDFNKDGKPDLALVDKGTFASTTNPGGVLIYFGAGNGNFQNPVSYPAGINPDFILAADVNGDNVPDLLVTTSSANFGFDVGVLLGNANGTFSPAALVATDFGPAAIAVADLNGDGKVDLVVAHCCGQTDITFMFGNGDGTFQPDVHFPAAASPTTVLLTDLNGDGKLDLLLGTNFIGFNYIGSFLNLSGQLNNVNGASFLSGPLAPDSFATAQGAALATVTQPAVSPYPTNIGGTTVSVRDSAGVQQLAALSYVSPSQVNYIVPHTAALGQATITITASNGTTSSAAAVIGAVGPGLFLFGGTNLLAANVLRVHADTSQSVENVYLVNSSGALVPAPIDLGPATDQVYLVLYATGLRGHSAAANSVTVTAVAVNLPVLYAGLQPEYPGLDQIDALLPRSLIGKGDVVLQVTVDGQIANTGHVTIK